MVERSLIRRRTLVIFARFLQESTNHALDLTPTTLTQTQTQTQTTSKLSKIKKLKQDATWTQQTKLVCVFVSCQLNLCLLQASFFYFFYFFFFFCLFFFCCTCRVELTWRKKSASLIVFLRADFFLLSARDKRKLVWAQTQTAYVDQLMFRCLTHTRLF